MTIPDATAQPTQITLRRLNGEDDAAVLRLSQLDSARPLDGELLGLEADGRLVAAISLTSGRSVSDPFRPTLESRRLLELRADQLQRQRRRPRARWLRRRSRAALPSSPPGGGGRLLDLLRASLLADTR